MQLYSISDKGELVELDKLLFEENDVYLIDDEEKNTIYIWVGLEVPQPKKDITAEIARKIDKERGGSIKILIMKQKREYGSFLAMMHNLEKGLIPGKTVERRPEFVFETPPERIKSIGLNGIPEEREINIETRIRQWFQQIQAHQRIEPPRKPQEATDTVKFIRFESSKEKKEGKIQPQKEKPEKQIVDEEPETTPIKFQIREAAYYFSLKGYTYNELCWILAEKIQKINLDMPSIEDIKQKAEQVFNSSCTYDELCWLNAEMDILTKERFLEKEYKSFKY
ncbi:MAG: hypothetical protein ACFFA4_15080 [Promethearchaeota archaeon]